MILGMNRLCLKKTGATKYPMLKALHKNKNHKQNQQQDYQKVHPIKFT
jgi:hypothetical protein